MRCARQWFYMKTDAFPSGDFMYLFDCDGTIVDWMPLHYVAWTSCLAEYGCTSFTEELFYAWGGLPVTVVVEELSKRDGLTIPLEEFAHRKESLYYELIHELKAVPEVLRRSISDAWFGCCRWWFRAARGSLW